MILTAFCGEIEWAIPDKLSTERLMRIAPLFSIRKYKICVEFVPFLGTMGCEHVPISTVLIWGQRLDIFW
jgi:hypothetical protein